MGAKKKAAAEPVAQAPSAAPAAAAALKPESPVLACISKRLRANRKKLQRIEELEEAAANGKPPHPDQEGLLRSKPAIVAVIEELDKLGTVLKDSVKEELQAQKEQLQAKHAEKLAAAKEETTAARALLQEAQDAKAAAEAEAAEAREAAANPPPPAEPLHPPVDVDKERKEAMEDAVSRLLQLLYFAQVFDAEGGWNNSAERKACVSYDFSVPQQGAPLTEEALVELSSFGKSLITRPPRKLINHKGMVEQNLAMALQYLTRQEAEGGSPEFNSTVLRIEEHLQRVVASEYYSILPHVPETPPSYEEPKMPAAAPPQPSAPHPPQPSAPPATEGPVPPYPGDAPHPIHPLPPMPNISTGQSGNAILDDPAIAHSQIRRPGTSPMPPPTASAGAPKPGVVPANQGLPQQLHMSQVPHIFQQLLGQPLPGAYPGYMPQQRMPVPGYANGPPGQFGVQDPAMYSFGSISHAELQPSAPDAAGPPSSLPPPATHSPPPGAPLHPHPLAGMPPAPGIPDPSILQAVPAGGGVANGIPAPMPPPGAFPPPIGTQPEPQAAAAPGAPAGGYGSGYNAGGPRNERGQEGGRGRGSRGSRGPRGPPTDVSGGRGGSGSGERDNRGADRAPGKVDGGGRGGGYSRGSGGNRGGGGGGGRGGRGGRGGAPPTLVPIQANGAGYGAGY